jgi:cytochrome c553
LFAVPALIAALILLLAALPAAAETRPSRAEITRGEYLVGLLACARCHTEGYFTHNYATGPELAGSRIGIAYTEFFDEDEQPGLVFAGNLTPDPETGLGAWSRDDIMRALQTGTGRDGHQRLPVMPWPNYATLERADLRAIASYLKSLPPVTRPIPARTEPGGPPQHTYVRFGIYIFEPFDPVPPASR